MWSESDIYNAIHPSYMAVILITVKLTTIKWSVILRQSDLIAWLMWMSHKGTEMHLSGTLIKCSDCIKKFAGALMHRAIMIILLRFSPITINNYCYQPSTSFMISMISLPPSLQLLFFSINSDMAPSKFDPWNLSNFILKYNSASSILFNHIMPWLIN